MRTAASTATAASTCGRSARALWSNVRKGGVVSGGSTLTMQVVRIARKNPRRTYLEKVSEMILALRLELSCSKRRILDLHAANAPFGGNIVGIDAAAWFYFDRGPEALSWAEAAFLAVLPNDPKLIAGARPAPAAEGQARPAAAAPAGKRNSSLPWSAPGAGRAPACRGARGAAAGAPPSRYPGGALSRTTTAVPDLHPPRDAGDAEPHRAGQRRAAAARQHPQPGRPGRGQPPGNGRGLHGQRQPRRRRRARPGRGPAAPPAQHRQHPQALSLCRHAAGRRADARAPCSPTPRCISPATCPRISTAASAAPCRRATRWPGR